MTQVPDFLQAGTDESDDSSGDESNEGESTDGGADDNNENDNDGKVKQHKVAMMEMTMTKKLDCIHAMTEPKEMTQPTARM